MGEHIELTRRNFLKSGALFGASVMGAAAIGGCARTKERSESEASNDSLPTNASDASTKKFDYDALTGKSDAAGETYEFQHLGTPCTINGLEIKNRIVKSASSGAEAPFDVEKNEYTPQAIEFYRNLAKGGVGLIIHDTIAFKSHTPSSASFLSEDDIPLHTPYIDAVHEEGVPIFLQLFSSDNADDERYTGVPAHPHGSSSYAQKGADQGMNGLSPTPWTTEEVEEQIEEWANAAYRAKLAGFDGIEVNVGSNHIGANFISRYWNRERTDKYGSQDIESLGRFATDILDKARKLCGEDYPIGVLMNGHEWDVFRVGNNERCNSIELQCELAKLFVQHGADFIHVRSAAWGSHMLDIMPDVAFMHGEPDTGYGHPLEIDKNWPDFIQDYRGAGAFINTAATIKSAVDVPVITTGMMDVRLIPDVIDNAIGDGKIDFIGMTRRLFADPDYANKALDGKLAEIRPCANCLSCWHDYCRVNAGLVRAGGEDMPEGYAIETAGTRKRVLIAGGGPAGLEAAHVAAERGHEVYIYEKDSQWGGLALTAIAYKGKNEKIQDHIDWLVRQCEQNGVTMELGTEVGQDVIAKINPDVLIDATGGKETVPTIDGINGNNVVILSPDAAPQGSNIVIIGGQIEGIEAAIFFCKMGKNVTVLDEGPDSDLGKGIPGELLPKYLCWCQTHGVKTLSNVSLEQINSDGVDLMFDYGLKQTIPCDSVFVALPRSANPEILQQFGDSVSEAYAIGNASEYGLIREAVRDGNLLARHL